MIFCGLLLIFQSVKAENLEPIEAFQNVEMNNGSAEISARFEESQNFDTLDSFLKFLKEAQSPVTTVLELRSLLLAQKEEKVALQNLVQQMKLEMKGIKYFEFSRSFYKDF